MTISLHGAQPETIIIADVRCDGCDRTGTDQADVSTTAAAATPASTAAVTVAAVAVTATTRQVTVVAVTSARR